MLQRGLALNMCFTRYLIQKDCLTAAFTRMGHGFHPPQVISEAKHHLEQIQELMKQMEDLSKQPKDALVPFEKSCCGRE